MRASFSWPARAGALLGRVHGLAAATWHVRVRLADGTVVKPEQLVIGPEIYVFCERDALAMAAFLSWQRFWVLIAPGRDGDWASGAVGSFGSRVIRGATGRRGGPGLRELIGRLRGSPHPAAVVGDGPLGPTGRVRPGAILCAVRTGRPIVPVAAAAHPAVAFPATWSGLYEPLPLARVAAVCAEPLRPGPRVDRASLRAAAEELSDRLAHARRLALSLLHLQRPAFLDAGARRLPEA